MSHRTPCNCMLRTRDAMRELFTKSESDAASPQEAERLIQQTNRVERQAALLLRVLHAIYVALAAFAGATLVTLLGASLSSWAGDLAARVFAGLGILLGFVGVGGLVLGCAHLFHATQLSLINIRDEAAVIRQRHEARKTPA